MPEVGRERRVRILEQEMEDLRHVPARLAAVESQIVQLRQEMQSGFSALGVQNGETRAEMRALNDETRADLRAEMRALNGETRADLRSEMRVLTDETRAEMRALNGDTRTEMRALNQETQAQMRLLHEEVIARIALLHEGAPPAPSSRTRRARKAR